jgi:hypothetical protein
MTSIAPSLTSLGNEAPAVEEVPCLADELHRRGFPVWYPDGRPVSFIEDDWYDDFPLVWRDGWFSTAA